MKYELVWHGFDNGVTCVGVWYGRYGKSLGWCDVCT